MNWLKRNPLWSGLMGALLVLLIFYGAAIIPLKMKCTDLSGTLNEQAQDLEKYARQAEMRTLITPADVKVWQDAKDQKDTQYKDLVSFFMERQSAFEAPFEGIEPYHGALFKDRYRNECSRLAQRDVWGEVATTGRRGNSKTGFGFSNWGAEIPEVEEAKHALRLLRVQTEVADVIDASIGSIYRLSSFTFAEANVGPGSEMYSEGDLEVYAPHSFEMVFYVDFMDLNKFLRGLLRSKRHFRLKNITVERHLEVKEIEVKGSGTAATPTHAPTRMMEGDFEEAPAEMTTKYTHKIPLVKVTLKGEALDFLFETSDLPEEPGDEGGPGEPEEMPEEMG